MTIFRTKADYLVSQWEAGQIQEENLVIEEFLLLRKNGRNIPDRLRDTYIEITAAALEDGRAPRRKTGRPAGKGVPLEKRRQATREYLMKMRSGAGHKNAIAVACDICCTSERNAMRYIEKHRFWEEMFLIAEEKQSENFRMADGLRRLYLATCRMEVRDRNGKMMFHRVPRDDENVFRMPDGGWITVAMARELLRMVDEMLEEHAQNIEARARNIYAITRQLHVDRCNSLVDQENAISKEALNYEIEVHEHALTTYAMRGEFILRSIDGFNWSPRSSAALEKNRQRMIDIQKSLASLDPLTADKNAP
ncbi:hypothetical protein [Sphaerotilus sp.]|uniref:hypothetical protein n=1 Tax=Sphaerotilus sp. TaxID=2093942 RepID=UPI00286E51FE|nr:hypothetical protein [Sphaerotilus sp.]